MAFGKDGRVCGHRERRPDIRHDPVPPPNSLKYIIRNIVRAVYCTLFILLLIILVRLCY